MQVEVSCAKIISNKGAFKRISWAISRNFLNRFPGLFQDLFWGPGRFPGLSGLCTHPFQTTHYPAACTALSCTVWSLLEAFRTIVSMFCCNGFSFKFVVRKSFKITHYLAACTALSCTVWSLLEAFWTIVSRFCCNGFSFSSESVLSTAAGTFLRFSRCSSFLFC